GKVRKHLEPQFPRDFAVLYTHTIRRTTHADRKRRHSKVFVVVAQNCTSKCQKLTVIQLQRIDKFLAEALDQHVRRKSVVARGDRRVSGENTLFSNLCNSIRKAFVRIKTQPFSCELKCGERSVPFVEMINRWIDAELSQKPDTSDAQYLLLHDTGFGIASVKMARDHAVDRGVLIDVRVEQVERDPPDSCEPCLGVD